MGTGKPAIVLNPIFISRLASRKQKRDFIAVESGRPVFVLGGDVNADTISVLAAASSYH